jgi:hypothetical protein
VIIVVTNETIIFSRKTLLFIETHDIEKIVIGKVRMSARVQKANSEFGLFWPSTLTSKYIIISSRKVYNRKIVKLRVIIFLLLIFSPFDAMLNFGNYPSQRSQTLLFNS